MAIHKDRFPIPDQLAERLHRESALVHHYAASGEVWQPNSEPRKTLARRLDILKEAGLFYPGIADARQISLSKLMAAQAEVARLHQLNYNKAATGSRWSVQAQSEPASGGLMGRSRGYLSDLMRADVNKSVPKVDLALLAHTFQVPVAVLEAPTIDVMERYVQQVRSGFDLFADSLDFLKEVADSSLTLQVMELAHWNSQDKTLSTGARKGAVIVDRSATLRPVRLNTPLVLHADLRSRYPDTFSTLACVTDANGKSSLITTASLTDHTISHRASVTIPPEHVLADGEITFHLDSTGPHLFTLITGLDDLSNVSCYARTVREKLHGGGTTTVLTPADFYDIRRHLLQQKPDRWAVLQSMVDVIDSVQ